MADTVITIEQWKADFEMVKAVMPWHIVAWFAAAKKADDRDGLEDEGLLASLYKAQMLRPATLTAEQLTLAREFFVAGMAAGYKACKEDAAQAPQQNRSQQPSPESAALQAEAARLLRENQRIQERMERLEEARRRDIATPIPPGWTRAQP